MLRLQVGKVHARSTNVLAGALVSLQTLHTQVGQRLTLSDVLIEQVLANLTQLRASTKVLLEPRLTKLIDLRAGSEILRILLLTQCGKIGADAKRLSVILLTQSGGLLGCTKVLSKVLLTKVANLLGRTKVLRILLLAKRSSLLGRLLLGRTIGLSSGKVDTLLLLRSRLSLSKTRLKKIGKRRLIGKALLASKIGLLNTSAITAKCARLNSFPLHS